MKKAKNKKTTNLSGVVKVMLDAFQSNQEYMDKRFDNLAGEMKGGFSQVTEKINNLSRNAVDVVLQEDFDKLDDRVGVVEEALDLKIKRA